MLTQELAKELFKYNPETGDLIRRKTTGKKSLSGSVCDSVSVRGYLRVSINYNRYYVHRVIFLMEYGFLPEHIDHVDGNKINNKIGNLRECTKGENRMNAGIQSNNTSGVKGVCWHKRNKKWSAQITSGGKRVFIGYFDDIKDAKIKVEAVRALEHKEFSNNG